MNTKKKSGVTNDDLLFLLQKLYDKFGGFETRFDGLEKRFDGLETRFDGLETRFDGLEKRFDRFERKNQEDHDKMLTMIANLVGSVSRIEEDRTVLNHYNSEHFEKDKQQDGRLDTLETKLQLPKFAY